MVGFETESRPWRPERAAGVNRHGRRFSDVGGGGGSRQEVCDWNPESYLLRAQNLRF
ncbi:MAG: hypothetical protein FWH12_07410 [Treponema sp.]|nr:hypothetical protein [Treponema sp.]